MIGLKTDLRNCKVKPGSYVEASVNGIITNDISEQTMRSVALGPAGNCQGSVNCFSIKTGKILYRHTATPVSLPKDNHLIQNTESWGKQELRAIQ